MSRDPITGQYAFDGDLNRLCKCGHRLGVHVSGGFDCINQDVGDGAPCDCRTFRPSPTPEEQHPPEECA